MNDKIKQLLATAYKVDGLAKIKWRIENWELLKKQSKIELKRLMKNDQQSSIEWLVKELNQKIDFIPMSKWDEIKEVIEQAKAMHKAEIEESYQDGKEIGTIETLLKNKNL